MNIKHRETNNVSFRSMTLNGFSFKMFINPDGGSAQAGSTAIDFSKYTVKLILNRDGGSYIIASDNLQILGLASTLNTAGQLAFNQGANHYINLGNNASLLFFNLSLGGHVRLKDNDELYVEVQDQGAIGAGYQGASYLEVKPLQSIGYETFIPMIQSKNIQAGTTSQQYSLGDNVIRTVLLNFDKTSFAANVVNSIGISSDKINDSFTFADLIDFKLSSFATGPQNLAAEESAVIESDQSFVITDFNNVYNKLLLNCQFNGGNVAASQNYIVFWSYLTSKGIIADAQDLAAKHDAINTAAIPTSIAK